MYETFVSVNKKWIRTTETETEHNDKIRRLRAAQKAQAIEEQRKKTGEVPGVTIICPGCGRQMPYNNITKSGDYYCKHCGRASKNYKGGPSV